MELPHEKGICTRPYLVDPPVFICTNSTAGTRVDEKNAGGMVALLYCTIGGTMTGSVLIVRCVD